MRFEETDFATIEKYSKVEFSFGAIYLCENFVISELNEGTHFDWDKILEVIGVTLDFYGKNFQIAYISNRIESYSIEPLLWLKFHKEFDFIIAMATISYSDFGYINASIEKQFAQVSLKRCEDLPEAITWVKNLREFNQN